MHLSHPSITPPLTPPPIDHSLAPHHIPQVGYTPFYAEEPVMTCRKILRWQQHLEVSPSFFDCISYHVSYVCVHVWVYIIPPHPATTPPITHHQTPPQHTDTTQQQIPQEARRRVSKDCLDFLHALFAPADRRLGTQARRCIRTYICMCTHV